MPVDGLRLLQMCLDLADGRGLVLVADEGPLLPDEVCVDRDPVPCVTGDVRLPISFEFLRLHALSRKGFCESTTIHEDYRVCMLAYGFESASLPRTRLSFKQCLEVMSVDCIHILQESLLQETKSSLRTSLLLLRLTQGDQDTMIAMRSMLNREAWSDLHKEDLSIQLTQVRKRKGFDI